MIQRDPGRETSIKVSGGVSLLGSHFRGKILRNVCPFPRKITEEVMISARNSNLVTCSEDSSDKSKNDRND